MPLGLVAKGLMAGSLVEIKRRAWARAATAIRDGTTSRTQAVDLRGPIRQVVGGEADCGHSAALAAQQKAAPYDCGEWLRIPLRRHRMTAHKRRDWFSSETGPWLEETAIREEL